IVLVSLRQRAEDRLGRGGRNPDSTDREKNGGGYTVANKRHNLPHVHLVRMPHRITARRNSDRRATAAYFIVRMLSVWSPAGHAFGYSIRCLPNSLAVRTRTHSELEYRRSPESGKWPD